MPIIAVGSQILSVLTVTAQIVILVTLILFFTLPKKSKDKLKLFLSTNAIKLAFLVALAATSGSLFYSEIAGYEPCVLCWFQRIFMYPQVVLFAVALFKKDRSIIDYAKALSLIGMVIAGYHYLLQIGLAPSITCGAVGYSVSCAKRFVMEFGYITLPMMGLTAFAAIFLLMLSAKSFQKQERL